MNKNNESHILSEFDVKFNDYIELITKKKPTHEKHPRLVSEVYEIIKNASIIPNVLDEKYHIPNFDMSKSFNDRFVYISKTNLIARASLNYRRYEANISGGKKQLLLSIALQDPFFLEKTEEIYKNLFMQALIFAINNSSFKSNDFKNSMFIFNQLYTYNKETYDKYWNIASNIVYDSVVYIDSEETLNISVSVREKTTGSIKSDLGYIKFKFSKDNNTEKLKRHLCVDPPDIDHLNKYFLQFDSSTKDFLLNNKMHIVLSTKCFDSESLLNKAIFSLSFLIKEVDFKNCVNSSRKKLSSTLTIMPTDIISVYNNESDENDENDEEEKNKEEKDEENEKIKNMKKKHKMQEKLKTKKSFKYKKESSSDEEENNDNNSKVNCKNILSSMEKLNLKKKDTNTESTQIIDKKNKKKENIDEDEDEDEDEESDEDEDEIPQKQVLKKNKK